MRFKAPESGGAILLQMTFALALADIITYALVPDVLHMPGQDIVAAETAFQGPPDARCLRSLPAAALAGRRIEFSVLLSGIPFLFAHGEQASRRDDICFD